MDRSFKVLHYFASCCLDFVFNGQVLRKDDEPEAAKCEEVSIVIVMLK